MPSIKSTYSDALEQYMKGLSEKYFRQPWANGLAFTLWHWLHTGQELTAAERYNLWQCHTKAGGWIDEEGGDLLFLTTSQWNELYISEFGNEGELFTYE